MVKSMEITKVTVREKLVIDANVLMEDPRDYDFSPRASIEGSTVTLYNDGDEEPSTMDFWMKPQTLYVHVYTRMQSGAVHVEHLRP